MKLIELNKGGKSSGKYFAKVDDSDYDYLMQWKWEILLSGGYAQRREYVNGRRISILMHRVILGIEGKKIHGDHKNGNGLDNQRGNLRRCTQAQNTRNRKKKNIPNLASKYKGVSYCKRDNVWVARITYKGRTNWLGKFKNEDEAARAYNERAIVAHGEFAKINEMQETHDAQSLEWHGVVTGFE